MACLLQLFSFKLHLQLVWFTRIENRKVHKKSEALNNLAFASAEFLKKAIIRVVISELVEKRGYSNGNF